MHYPAKITYTLRIFGYPPFADGLSEIFSSYANHLHDHYHINLMLICGESTLVAPTLVVPSYLLLAVTGIRRLHSLVSTESMRNHRLVEPILQGHPCLIRRRLHHWESSKTQAVKGQLSYHQAVKNILIARLFIKLSITFSLNLMINFYLVPKF